MNGRNDEAWAVFWCSLPSPLLTGEIPADRRGRYFRELSEQERLLPNGQRKRISRAERSRPISRPGSTATAATSSAPAIMSARASTSWWTRCSAPGASTAPATNCTSITPRFTTPRRSRWLAPR